MERTSEQLDPQDRISISVQRGTARIGIFCIQDDSQEEEVIHSGADRSGKDDGDDFSGGTSCGGRVGGENFLPDRQDDHEDSRRAGI